MNCPNYPDEKLLDAYGELEADAVEYRRHFRNCSGCKRDRAELRTISMQFRMAQSQAAPHSWTTRWGTPMAAALLFAFLVSGIFPTTSQFREEIGQPSVRAEAPPSWEQDEFDWDEQIACLQSDIGSLENELGRLP